MRTEHDTARYELTLSFDELTLIYKSLLAGKSLGVLSQSDELVDDTIQLVYQALSGEAVA
jgi:hypothetical protein